MKPSFTNQHDRKLSIEGFIWLLLSKGRLDRARDAFEQRSHQER